MIIGCPREVKADEYRVALTPTGARALSAAGHQVLVEQGAGAGAHFRDEEYQAAGARVVAAAADAWGADLVVKVKEPITSEYGFLRPELSLFTFLHMAADRPLTQALLASRATSIAYEDVTERDGSLPLLAPMSEVAGRLATQVGANVLLQHHGGRGVLLGGVPGAPAAKVVVIGGGVAGRHAAEIAIGMGARVSILDINVPLLRQIDWVWGGRIQTLVSTREAIEDEIRDADLLIGAVLVPGSRAPRLVSSAAIEGMQEGAVLVDIAIDQGGCFEPSRPTTHHEPTFRYGPVIMYCVANMPGAVPRTSTIALTNATLPYVISLASDGALAAARRDPRLAAGVCTVDGALFLSGVAEAHGLPLTPLEALVAGN